MTAAETILLRNLDNDTVLYLQNLQDRITKLEALIATLQESLTDES